LIRLHWLLTIMLLPGLLGFAAPVSQASYTLTLTYPVEGQILYAGPGVPRYVVSVIGRVEGTEASLAGTRLRVDLFRGDQPITGFDERPAETGDFEFRITVNPEASALMVPPEHYYCQSCHVEIGKADLAEGENLLVVTATAPDGAQAVVHRRIIVDKSGFANLPVSVAGADAAIQDLAGIPVVAATEFPVTASQSTSVQTREFSAQTDAAGRVYMQVESLATADLHYRVYVPPTVHGNALISSEAVSLTVPANTLEAGPVEIRINAANTQLSGAVKPAAGAGSVYAVSQTDGRVYAAAAEPETNAYGFSHLPIDRYLVGVVDAPSGAHVLSNVSAVDLAAAPQAQLDLRGEPAPVASVHGVVLDSAGWPLPFAWITGQATGSTVRTNPANGEFTLPLEGGGTRTLNILAPGYWSKAEVVRTGDDAPAKITLGLRPDSRQLTLDGSGWVVLPQESTVDESGDMLKLYDGWIWGHTGSAAYTFGTPATSITVEPGSDFAVEHPAHRTAWLYMRSGQARVMAAGRTERVLVSAGEMVRLASETTPVAAQSVPVDPVAFALLQAGVRKPLDFKIEPGLASTASTALARLGIGAAQILTLVTYVLAPVSVLVALAILVAWLIRRRTKSATA